MHFVSKHSPSTVYIVNKPSKQHPIVVNVHAVLQSTSLSVLLNQLLRVLIPLIDAMFSSTIAKMASLLLAASAVTSTSASENEQSSARRVCYDETPDLYCYSGEWDIPQEVVLADVDFIASYLRSYGRQLRDGRREFILPCSTIVRAKDSLGRSGQGGEKVADMWGEMPVLTMTAVDAPDCGEWSLYRHNSAMAVAKKIDMTFDSAVLFEDIANTIDGGTSVFRRNGIHRCGLDGGSMGVQVNSTHPSYSLPTYVNAGYQPAGIIIKIVANM